MSASAMVAGNSFNGIFTAKSRFYTRVFYINIADVDIGSLKSIYTLFDKYLDHMLVKFEHRPNYTNFELFDKRWLTIFDKGLTPF